MREQAAGRRSACRLDLAVCLALVTVSAAPVAAQSNMTAGTVLLNFKEGITNWAAVTGTFEGWTNATQSVCNWTGVACDGSGNVTSLSLQGVGLVGPLPAGLGDLTQLQVLNLASNQLTGTLPDTWGSTTALFGLQQLLLTSNQLGGGLPSEWGRPGRWPALASLQLGDNNFTGGLPTEWADPDAFKNLTDLDLSLNALKGPLSPDWGEEGGFTSLQNLDLSNNSFSGQLPAGWGGNSSFPALAHLLLSNNSLSGSLPAGWGSRGRWPALAGLYLQNNNFTGSLPEAWYNRSAAFPQLGELLLRPGNPGLCGPLPANTSFTVQYTASSGAAFALTGTLGSCAQACGSLTTSSNATNLFDISVEAQVALADLLQFNPSANVNAPVAPGTSLTRPCYPNNSAPSYLGGNIAYGKVATQSTTVGDGDAGLAVASPSADAQATCTLTRNGTTAAPAWWMLDLGVSTDLVGVVIATQTAVDDLKIAIGDSDSPLANAECSVGVQIEANATSAQVCNGKGRYLTLSRLSGGAISLCGVEVFPVAANAATSKPATASGGTGAYLATDGADSGCSAVSSANAATGAWITVDLGYRGQFAAVGVDLGQADLTELNLRVGNETVVNGTENPLCLATVANLPGYSKTLFGCEASGRYLTAQAPAASSMDVCLLSAFLQDSPDASGSVALTPSSELTLAPGPAVDLAAQPSPAHAPAPSSEALAPDQIVLIQFRLVLIGPYVVNFDGKEDAVINALSATLQPVDPIAINITSYTVGAPVPSSTPATAPAPEPALAAAPSAGPPPPRTAGRRLAAADEAAAWLLADDFAVVVADWAQGPRMQRKLQQQVTEGAVIINVQVRTTASKEAATTQLMETAIASGAFTKVLQTSGLDAQAVRLSVVPTAGALPAPEPAPGVAGDGAVAPSAQPIPSAKKKGGSSSTGVVAGGVIGGLAVGLLLAALLWFWLARRRRRARAAGDTAALAAGGKGDIESGSDTGSSSGGGYAGGGGGRAARGGVHPSCWPFNRRAAKQHPSGDSSSARHSADSPGGMYGSTAFLSKGEAGVAKAERPVFGQVHANARSGAATPLGMAGAHMQHGGQHGGSAASLRDAYSMPGTPGGTSASGAGGSDGGLLLPAGAFVRSNSSGLLGSPSGWETPLGMGGDGHQLGLQGPLGQLQRGVSDVLSEVEVINEEDSTRQRWSATSAELWPIMYKELTFLKQIGEGSFGRVYMARWRETTVAVKVLHRQSGDHLDDDDLPLDPCPSAGSPDPILNALQKEAGIMASVRHPNVISYLGVCAEPACIVTEYCSKGSLTDVLRRGRASVAHRTALDWPRRLNMAMDAAKGMLHLHLCDPPIIHRDLKSPNLLVDKHWKLKVCDFNLSRVMEESVVLSSMVASNPRWLAPEILAGLPYTVAADVYSFGIIMWELLTWEVPWHQQNTWQVHAMVTVEHLRPDIPADIAATPGSTFGGISAYLELMRACWAQSPDDRPDFETVIGRLRRMLAVETLARQPSVAGSSHGSPSRNPSGHHDRMLTAATASAPNNASSPLATR